ncbi:MAG: class II fructose-bisphosphate aldolase [bacterium]
MLIRPHELLTNAMDSDFAIGAFNTSNLEITQAIVAAAAAQSSPVIVQTSEGAIEYAGLKVLTQIVKTIAEECEVPVVLHLDHGKSPAVVKRCIEAGYGSVMIDASRESFEDNISMTREVVAYAHERGVWVEAELGAILGAEGMKNLKEDRTPDEMLTDPSQAEQFVEETRVDALAVSVGTMHGAFTGKEYIRFELVEKLGHLLMRVPLVLHGASGITAEHLQKVARSNVCKVNIDTEMRIAFEGAVKAYFSQGHKGYDPRKIIGPAREAVQRVVEEKIKILGSADRVRV